MSKLEWNKTGDRQFETGVDRGVFYPKRGNGLAWNGLSAVNESVQGGAFSEFYYDGVKYLDLVATEDFQASIEVLSYPPEFEKCLGNKSVFPGVVLTRQRPEIFDFSYRTLLGNDVLGVGLGYKIHLVYNATAAPSGRQSRTLGQTFTPAAHQLAVTTVPVEACGRRPTSHLVLDSRFVDPLVLLEIEEKLYGTSTTEPKLPTQAELVTMLGGVGTGVYSLDVTNAQTYNVSEHTANLRTWFEPYPNQGDASLVDGSDLTYETTIVSTLNPELESNAMAIIQPHVGSTISCESIALRVRLSVEDDSLGRDLVPVVFDQHKHGETTGDSGILVRWTLDSADYRPVLVPNDGMVHEFTLYVDTAVLNASGWDLRDEILAAMTDITSLICYIPNWASDGSAMTDPDNVRVRLHEVSYETTIGCAPVWETTWIDEPYVVGILGPLSPVAWDGDRQSLYTSNTNNCRYYAVRTEEETGILPFLGNGSYGFTQTTSSENPYPAHLNFVRPGIVAFINMVDSLGWYAITTVRVENGTVTLLDNQPVPAAAGQVTTPDFLRGVLSVPDNPRIYAYGIYQSSTKAWAIDIGADGSISVPVSLGAVDLSTVASSARYSALANYPITLSDRLAISHVEAFFDHQNPTVVKSFIPLLPALPAGFAVPNYTASARVSPGKMQQKLRGPGDWTNGFVHRVRNLAVNADGTNIQLDAEWETPFACFGVGVTVSPELGTIALLQMPGTAAPQRAFMDIFGTPEEIPLTLLSHHYTGQNPIQAGPSGFVGGGTEGWLEYVERVRTRVS